MNYKLSKIFIATIILLILIVESVLSIGIFGNKKPFLYISLILIPISIIVSSIILFVLVKSFLFSFINNSLEKIKYPLRDESISFKNKPFDYMGIILQTLKKDLDASQFKISLLKKYHRLLFEAITFGELLKITSEMLKSLSFVDIALFLRIEKNKNISVLYPLIPENIISKRQFPLNQLEQTLETIERQNFIYTRDLNSKTELNELEKVFLEKGCLSSFSVGIGKNEELFFILGVANKNKDGLSEDEIEFIKGMAMVLGMKVIIMDLSEQLRLAEEKLFEIKTIEKEKIQTQLSELKAMYAQVLQASKMASLGQLSAGVAHELNNPIAGILGYTQLILSKFKSGPITKENIEDSLRYLQMMEKEARRCQDIISNLLNFSRKSTEEKVILDVKEVIDTTLGMMEYQLKKANIEVCLSFPPEGLKKIKGNANQLQQVFTNLIQNAQDAMPQGGKLSITAENIMDARYTPALEYIQIKFSDTGCGIPKENLSKIFDPFFTSKLGKPGTGLGLAISYAIISSHKGLISVESELGKGTTFTITLPVAKE